MNMMTDIVSLGIILAVLWLAMLVARDMYHIACRVKEYVERSNPDSIHRRKNHIVINGKMYYPKRTGRNIDCKKECKLAQHCRQDGYGICVTLGAPDDDVIMTDGTDE